MARIGCLAALFAAAFGAAAQAQKGAGDWPMYRHDPASTGYSALNQIDTKNVTKLTQAWTMKLVERGGLEVTPIAVNGVMYLSAGNKVLAVDPQTGKEIWHYELAASQASSRGVAYWPGDGTNAPRIIFTTLDRKLIALDAATGKLVPTFATGGIAELTVGYNGVPTIFKNIALLGASVGELPRGPWATRALTTRSPANSFGLFTPSRVRVKSVTKPGSTMVGTAAPAQTSGAGT